MTATRNDLKNKLEAAQNTILVAIPLSCDQCEHGFESDDELSAHLLLEHGKETDMSDKRGEIILGKQELKDHEPATHNIGRRVPVIVRRVSDNLPDIHDDAKPGEVILKVSFYKFT